MDIEAFIARWKTAETSERANSQTFLNELCALLEVPKPHTGKTGDYCFEHPVSRVNEDGSKRHDGYIDLYKKGCFVLESKQIDDKVRASPSKYGDELSRARAQAEGYAKALEEWPPFLVVVDVGHVIELFADFSRSGKRYLPFKDAATSRLQLADLRNEDVRARLRQVWLDPMSLDPSRHQQRVTQAVAAPLAEIARSLEKDGHPPEAVASFLMRCIFTMFAEDVRLIPEKSFTTKLKAWKEKPEKFVKGIQAMWMDMADGSEASTAFGDVAGARVLCFNGGLFAHVDAFPLTTRELTFLLNAAEQDWKEVDPSIFGTLLERALNPTERHKLGAHFTPRAYVDRLVQPTVVEPLRADWDRVQQAVSKHLLKDTPKGKAAAKKELLEFHHQLCATKVLDPACGTGNFLYVALEHMKRLEGEVLERLAEIEGTRRLDLFGKDHETVDPHQFLGIEVNERAAVIAELVLWIGYLQWHFRNAVRQGDEWPEPVLKKFGNIERRDAVLAWDSIELERDPVNGAPLKRWDGVSTVRSNVTGEDVPDTTKTVTIERYVNPRKAAWPKADFVVGNPPFLGKVHLLQELGQGYVDALRSAFANEVDGSADLVMHWWALAGAAASKGLVRRFGFVTTNSISQNFNRRVVGPLLEAGLRLHLAIPDHPWVESSEGAAVRIAMTVAERGAGEGTLATVVAERSLGDIVDVTFRTRSGLIHADLTVGANVASALPLLANAALASMGPMVGSRGFVVDAATRAKLSNSESHLEARIAPLRNGKDLVDRARGLFVIDVGDMSEEQLRSQAPGIYQHLALTVRPERQANRDARLAANWWKFRRGNEVWRSLRAGLSEVIVTVETAKHRVFFVLPQQIIAEHGTVTFGFADRFRFGVMSARAHVVWALAAGGRLGIGNDPRYNKTRCFDPFPFPDANSAHREQLRALGEALEAHRKRQQVLHPELTITGMYNVLEKLRSNEALSQKEKVIHEQGLVSVLRQIHDDLDAAVFDAYGWPKDLTDEQILERLVALNHQRAAEEKRGIVKWLRPDYQQSLLQQAPAATQPALVDELDDDEEEAPKPKPKAAKKEPWPQRLPAQLDVVEGALRAAGGGTAASVAAAFVKARADDVGEMLDVLCGWGRAEKIDGESYVPLG